ncbi:hypothetical protein GH714_010500 [Hevea brasiliensis]|uniref:Uncharacterized protein n=1 Tax=Hevea brasiliensis TaxID=3981 RepID=A0A6A6KCP1_HEVBR|nr:hypothetical protein GH714_010500 [Hevea brasiliensis]
MKDQSMPKPIQGLVGAAPASSTSKAEKESYKKSFHEDFEPIPDVSSYHNDAGLKARKPLDGKFFLKDYELIPDVLAYHNNVDRKAEKPMNGKSFLLKDFKPIPDLSIYHDNAGLKAAKSMDRKPFLKGFEPIPDAWLLTLDGNMERLGDSLKYDECAGGYWKPNRCPKDLFSTVSVFGPKSLTLSFTRFHHSSSTKQTSGVQRELS